jgi:VWFA-related protein
MKRISLTLALLAGFAAASFPFDFQASGSGRVIAWDQAGRRPPRREKPTTPPDEKEEKAKATEQAGQKKPETAKEQTSAQGQRPPRKEEKEVQIEGEAVKLTSELVSVPVVVFGKKDGRIYTGLKRQNFTVYEDEVKQNIVTFSSDESPITLVMVLEYSKQIEWFREEVINPAGLFVTRFVKPGDYIAIVAFDIRPAVLNDFTDNGSKLRESVYLLIRNLPAFSESNLFDTLNFVLRGGTVDGVEYTGLQEIEGRTAILLVSIGIDTFSKINFDQARKIVENSGVPIYSIGIGELFFILYESRMPPEMRLTFLQAQNTLKTFSENSGGRYYPVRFQGALNSVLDSISVMLRTQYTLGYMPTNSRRDGKRRKIKILVDVDGDGKPDNDRVEVQARQSYVEPKDEKKK